MIQINVWTVTSSLVEKQLESKLDSAEKVLIRLQDEKHIQFQHIAMAIASNSHMLQAILSRDEVTTSDLLSLHIEGTGADFVAVLNNQGEFIFNEPQTFQVGDAFEYQHLVFDLLADNRVSTNGIGILNNALYYMTIVPIPSNENDTVLLACFKMDTEVLTSLKEIINADLVVYKQSKHAPFVDVVSATIGADTAANLVIEGSHQVSWFEALFQTSDPFVTRDLVLSKFDNTELRVTLVFNVIEQHSSFFQLQLSIIGISILAIILSTVIAFFVARRVVRPMTSLIEGVKRIASGNYGKTLDVSGKLLEIKHLAIAFETMQESIASREKHILYQSQHDNLTSLFNRNYIKNTIDRRLDNDEHIQVIGLNIIGFRQINDLYGYENGDACLIRIAERLTRWPGDASRLSGSDIFWIPESPLDDVKLETLKFILEQPVDTNGLTIPIRIKIGVMDLPVDAQDAEHLFRRMNIVIDQSSDNTQWLMRYSEDLESCYLRRLDIITELKRALWKEQSEFSMVYQPKVCLHTKKVTSVEALLRWNNHKLGNVFPDEFIPIAEQANLIGVMTEWVMGQATADLKQLKLQGYNLCVAINVSSQDIENRVLLTRFADRLEALSLTPSDVELEIIESDFVSDQAMASEKLSSLRELGFNFAIDDFGTGYSSLSYLKNLPVDTIKIDKSFVMNLASNKEDQKIVNIVLKLAQSFGLMVVAEGVEDEMSMALLTEWGCTLAQGYYICKPKPFNELITWIEEKHYET
ncbi:sensor domain-containing phosphodiesterase [Alteromonas sp. 5E99-2]|uniref:EAL domain-containing protein n=1 Tax=Alteromonas sp. 5E99-2 TaxID=2817683 RepID=UPI001A99C68C